MRSSKPGQTISPPEVVSVSKHGFWLNVNDTEYFLPFERFPWFRGVGRAELGLVELLHDTHLYWPDLDVDLTLDIIEEPEKYPLVWA